VSENIWLFWFPALNETLLMRLRRVINMVSNMKPKLLLLTLSLLLPGCVRPFVIDDTSFCDHQIEYLRISAEDKSADAIIEAFENGTPSEVIDAFNRSAQRVERALARGYHRSVGDLFYQNQIREIKKICGFGKNEFPELDSAGFVESVSASLIHAADLRGDSPESLNSIVRNDSSQNLTARMNFLIMSASCSKKDMPRLEKNLSEMGLGCKRP
jgi:hypothetical protein